MEDKRRLLKKKNKEFVTKRRRRLVLILLTEMAACFLCGIAVYGLSILNSYGYEELDPGVYKETLHGPASSVTEITDEEGRVISSSEIPVYTDTSEYRNILLVGIDVRDQYDFLSSGVNSDVMIVASINNKTGEVKLVSILRDTLMKYEAGSKAYEFGKANEQFYSGISDTVSMINRNLGLDIGEYILFNWYGVATCINQVGGVEMTIPDERFLTWFNGYLSDVNERTGIWAPQLSAPGTYNLTGTQAVAYCRIRYGGINDTGRTANQREVITKVLEKAKGLLKAGEVNQLLTIAQTGLGNVKTNLKLPEILFTATDLGRYKITDTRQFPMNYTSAHILGKITSKYQVLDPLVAVDFAEEVRSLHEFLFNDPNYKVSDFVRSVSNQLKSDLSE